MLIIQTVTGTTKRVGSGLHKLVTTLMTEEKAKQPSNVKFDRVVIICYSWSMKGHSCYET